MTRTLLAIFALLLLAAGATLFFAEAGQVAALRMVDPTGSRD